ncbi:MAG: phosphonate metabolism protein/1,5-bisphosphokinase (PRPP-forming) PhnN [Pseudomonadales bacterium]
MASRGTFLMVVGPSGAGKDTLLEGFRAGLGSAAVSSFEFARREITRPEHAGGEAHEAVGVEAFKERRRLGTYLLAWDAHGLSYAIPRHYERFLAQGTHVVANVSRAVIPAARDLLQPCGVILVTASEATLAQRLRARGREEERDLAARLARARAFAVSGPDVVSVYNDGTLGEGVVAFRRAVARLTGVPL